MKIWMPLAFALTCSTAAIAANGPSPKDKEAICKQIAAKHAGKMMGDSPAEKISTCVKEGTFSKEDDGYNVLSPTEEGLLDCTAKESEDGLKVSDCEEEVRH